jgi:hypothetical protein
MNRISLSLLGLALVGACAHNPPPEAGPPPPPTAEERYATLPDTSVCVVDRTTRRGLRPLAAKVEPGGQVVVLVSGRVQKLEELHPIGIVAGYAAHESWVTSGEPLTIQGRRYEKVGPARLIGLEQLQHAGDYRSIPLFADPNDPPPPRAFYVPLRPGCVFQAYVRSDLLQ